MIPYLDIEQGTLEWHALRLGIPTASEFSRIITPLKWEPTKGETRMRYKVELLTEIILGEPLSNVTAAAMEHGKAWEPKAIAAYELEKAIDVQRIGFATTDDGMIGCSPDALAGQEGSLEIKSPWKPEIHVGNLVNQDDFVKEHWVQVQGQLYVTGRKWTDLVSYFYGLPMVCVRITPHEEFQGKLHAALQTFCCELRDLVERAKREGWIPERKAAQIDVGRDWITDEDLEFHLARVRAQNAEQR